MKKLFLCLVLMLVGVAIQRLAAQNYIAQPYFEEGKVRFYAQASPINPATVAYTLDVAPAMMANWQIAPNANNGPNAVLIYNNKLFVSFDLGIVQGGVLVYNMLDITAPPTVIKPGGTTGTPCAGMAIQPSTGNLYIATFSGGGNGADGGIYYSTAASGYTNSTLFAGYNNSNAIDLYTANVYFDGSNNLWATTWSGNTDATQMFLVCFKNTVASDYRKIINTATKAYTAISTAGASASVHLLSAPEGMARDASGNLWVGNNNDFSAVNTTTVNNVTTYNGTLVKINNAFVTNLLAQPAGTTTTVPVANVNAYHIINGKLGGMAISGNTLYINDQGQNQGNSYLTNGTVWRYDVTATFNATNFKASGIRTSYPGNGQMSFNATLPIVVPPPPPATKLFVKANATGLNNGTSWANAYTNIQSALDNTNLDTVFVAAGTYYPTRSPINCSNCADSRSYTIQMRNNVKVFGGFAGTETWLSQRPAIGAQPSILSGNIGSTIASNDNSFHVVLVYEVTGVQIDGFTIRDGWADGPNQFSTTGSIGNFICNTSGAGVFANASSFIMKNCTIRNNTIQAVGGTSQNNTIESGAGVYVNNHTTVDFINDDFINNWATNRGGGLFVDGYGANYTSISKCNFISNISNNYGGGCDLTSTYSGYLGDCIFTGNTAKYGGGLSGGGNIADITIYNSVFAGNTISSSFAGQGAGVYFNDIEGYDIINSTFYNNKALNASSLGAGLYAGVLNISPGTRNAIIKNTIFYNNVTGNTSANNTRDDIYNANSSSTYYANVSNSLIGNNNPFTNMNNMGGNLINTNPQFTNAASPIGADGIWRTVDDGLRLTCTSPAVGTGTATGAPLTDITNATRNGIPDIGAYEAPCNQPAIFTSNSSTCQTITQNAVTGNDWFHFTNAAGIVCSINPQGQNLGNVTAKVADPTGIMTNGTTRYMGRSVNLTSTIAPSTNYLLRMYFKDTEIAEFQAATGQTGLTPQNFKVLWASGGAAASCGVNNFYGTTGGVFDNASITTGEFGQSNEGFYLQIALNHFTLFAATTDTENTLVGTENEAENSSANAIIYPNPTTDDLTIELTGNTDVAMQTQIFDVMGRAMTPLRPIQNGKATISMQEMPTGIYSLVITNGTQILVSKRVVKL